MSRREDQPTGDLRRYVQSRQVAADAARAREREAKERSEREQQQARERGERERRERELQLLDAPPHVGDVLTRFKVREVLEEVRRDFWKSAEIKPVRPQKSTPGQWGYTLEEHSGPYRYPSDARRYDNTGVSMGYSVGRGSYTVGSSTLLTPDTPSHLSREIKVVTPACDLSVDKDPAYWRWLMDHQDSWKQVDDQEWWSGNGSLEYNRSSYIRRIPRKEIGIKAPPNTLRDVVGNFLVEGGSYIEVVIVNRERPRVKITWPKGSFRG